MGKKKENEEEEVEEGKEGKEDEKREKKKLRGGNKTMKTSLLGKIRKNWDEGDARKKGRREKCAHRSNTSIRN